VIGFARDALRERQAAILYSETCPETPASQHAAGSLPGHVIAKNLGVLPLLDASIPERLRFPLDVPVSPALDTIRRQLAVAGADRFSLVNPGAAWPNKRWPADRFGAVAMALRRTRRLASVITWGPGEEALAHQVVAASEGAAIAAPPTGVGDLVAIAAEAALALSGDTGPLHIAAAMGAPIVAIFGPTDPARNGPWAPADISLSRFGDCVCHYERRCRRQRPCIEEITVEDVLGAIDRRLAFAPRAHA
jgi:ADP-heptose:LPS heptosyltransferase